MLFTFLIVTPLHDTMVTIASTMTLISIFYITVFVVKSRLQLFKFLCIACLLVFYCSLYIYYSGTYLKFLPIMQKITFAITVNFNFGIGVFFQKGRFSTYQSWQVKQQRRRDEPLTKKYCCK